MAKGHNFCIFIGNWDLQMIICRDYVNFSFIPVSTLQEDPRGLVSASNAGTDLVRLRAGLVVDNQYNRIYIFALVSFGRDRTKLSTERGFAELSANWIPTHVRIAEAHNHNKLPA